MCLIVSLTTGLNSMKAAAAEVHGGGDIGVWFLQNTIKDNKKIVDDGIGQNHIFDRYSLAWFGLKLDANDLLDGKPPFTLNTHFKGKLFLRLTDTQYTLGFTQKTRQEIDELNVEAQKVGGVADVWFGRQMVYEAGGVHFDGLRGIYHVNPRIDVALYGGLDADPRQLTGYIGPSYEKNPFSINFQTGGLYSTYRGDSLKTDAAVRSEFFKGKLDRFSVYSQASYQLDAVWGFSGSVDADVAGVKGFRNLTGLITTRPVPWVTNTLSFSRWSTLQYKASNVSAIPVTTGVDNTPIGNDAVNQSSYNSAREHIQFRIFQRNYIFTAFQFTRRTFDHLNQYKYSLGYRDPRLFDSSFDLRVQTDLIKNYRGFNTTLDSMLGKEWNDGEYRLEGGGAVYANERNVYVNFQADSTLPRQVEKEYSLRLNGYYNASRYVSWLLNYALHHEVDATNQNQKVNTHEVYLSTNFRF